MADPDEDTVEFPAITDEPDGWQVAGLRRADGVVTIEIFPLGSGELSGEQDAEGAPQGATSREGGQAMTGT